MGCVSSQQNENRAKTEVYRDHSSVFMKNDQQKIIQKGRYYRSVEDKNRRIRTEIGKKDKFPSQSTTQEKKQSGDKISSIDDDKIYPKPQQFNQKVQQSAQGFLQKTQRLKQSLLRAKVKNIQLINLNSKNEEKTQKQKMHNSSNGVAQETDETISRKLEKFQIRQNRRFDTSASSHESPRQLRSQPNRNIEAINLGNDKRNLSVSSQTRSPVGKPCNLFKTFKDDRIELENKN